MKKMLVYALNLSLALILVGCASASPARGELVSDLAGGMEAPEEMMAEGAFAQAEPAPFGTAAPASRTSFADTGQNQQAERLVIRNANLSLVVPSPAESIQEISRLAGNMGGFVVSSNVFQTFFDEAGISADRASITIRVPAERLDEALEEIRAGATEVQSENISGQDVTQEFTDLQSQLRNLEAAEERLLEILEQASDTEDVLNVFNRLTQNQEQIEIVKGRIQYLSESAALSAISVELIPDVAAAPLQIGGWQPEGTAKEAFSALIRALRTLGDAAIWAGICVIPVGLILGVPGYFVGRTIRRRRRTSASERTESATKKE